MVGHTIDEWLHSICWCYACSRIYPCNSYVTINTNLSFVHPFPYCLFYQVLLIIFKDFHHLESVHLAFANQCKAELWTCQFVDCTKLNFLQKVSVPNQSIQIIVNVLWHFQNIHVDVLLCSMYILSPVLQSVSFCRQKMLGERGWSVVVWRAQSVSTILHAHVVLEVHKSSFLTLHLFSSFSLPHTPPPLPPSSFLSTLLSFPPLPQLPCPGTCLHSALHSRALWGWPHVLSCTAYCTVCSHMQQIPNRYSGLADSSMR